MLNWRCGLGMGWWCCAALSRPSGPSAATAAASSVMYIQACPTACAVDPKTLLLGGTSWRLLPACCCTALSFPSPVMSRHIHLGSVDHASAWFVLLLHGFGLAQSCIISKWMHSNRHVFLLQRNCRHPTCSGEYHIYWQVEKCYCARKEGQPTLEVGAVS